MIITTLQSDIGVATKTFKHLPDGRLDVSEYVLGHEFAWREWEIDDIFMLAEGICPIRYGGTIIWLHTVP